MNNRFKYTSLKSWTESGKTCMYFTLSHILHEGYTQLAKMQCSVIHVYRSLPM